MLILTNAAKKKKRLTIKRARGGPALADLSQVEMSTLDSMVPEEVEGLEEGTDILQHMLGEDSVLILTNNYTEHNDL